MAETKKITKKVVLNEIVNYFKDDNLPVGAVMSCDIVNYALHEIELLEKKASKSGTTKVQKENEGLKEILKLALEEIGKPVTITELVENTSREEIRGLSNQKISALLKQLYDNKIIYKAMIKKRAYFSANEIDTANVNA